MKWKRNHAPGPRYADTTDGKWRMWQDGDGLCGLVRLPERVIVAVGSRDACLAKLEELAND